MVKANTQTAVNKLNISTNAVLMGPLLTSTGAFNYQAVLNFIATKAGGNPNNVVIQPYNGTSIASITMGKGGTAPCKTLGGFNATQHGVRQTMLYHAFNSQLTLGQWLNA